MNNNKLFHDIASLLYTGNLIHMYGLLSPRPGSKEKHFTMDTLPNDNLKFYLFNGCFITTFWHQH